MNDRPRPVIPRRPGAGTGPSVPIMVAALSLLAGCAQPTPPVRSGAAPGRRPPLQFAPGTVVETPPPADEAQLVNDPSAPTGTPLCGAAAQEAMAMAAKVNPAPLASGNSCVASACFDPLTGTYIGADGQRHICR
jgi:BA14K-like protein